MRPTTKRFRPRFSIRTLAILVTLVCCYAACWGPTRRDGPRDVTRYIYTHVNNQLPLGSLEEDIIETKLMETDGEVRPYAPLLLRVENSSLIMMDRFFSRIDNNQYYVWCFGVVIELPL